MAWTFRGVFNKIADTAHNAEHATSEKIHQAEHYTSAKIHHYEQRATETAHALQNDARVVVVAAGVIAEIAHQEIKHDVQELKNDAHNAVVVTKVVAAVAEQEIKHDVQVLKNDAQVAKAMVGLGVDVTKQQIRNEAQELGNEAQALKLTTQLVATGVKVYTEKQIENAADIRRHMAVDKEPSLYAALQTTIGSHSTITPAKVEFAISLDAETYMLRETNGQLQDNATLSRLLAEGNRFIVVPSPNKSSEDVLVVADANNNVQTFFRGTQNPHDYLVDIDFKSVPYNNKPHSAQVDRGFSEELDSKWVAVQAAIAKLSPHPHSVTFSGHSLGGAEATLAAARYGDAHPGADISLITFGSPRVGDQDFVNHVAAVTNGNHARFVEFNDPVTSAGFGEHLGKPIILAPDGVWVGRSADASTFTAIQHGLSATTNAIIAGGPATNHGSGNYHQSISGQIQGDNARITAAYNQIADEMKKMFSGLIPGIGSTSEPQMQAIVVPTQAKTGRDMG